MSTFDWYAFNIADKVQFKEAKPYLETMLSELGYSYERLGFSLRGTKDTVASAVKKYPSLWKYYIIDDSHELHVPTLTSFGTDWQEGSLYADPGDEADISALVSKIPRPINLNDDILVFEGIRWFSDSRDDTVIDYGDLYNRNHSLDGNWPKPNCHLFPILSNHITLRRFCDSGTKEVFVSVCMEKGSGNPDEILERLKPYLGEPTQRERKRVYLPDETVRRSLQESRHTAKLIAWMTAVMPASRVREARMRTVTILQPGNILATTMELPIPHICDKSTLDKAFHGTGFIRKKDVPNWLHCYICQDAHGYLYEAYAQKLSRRNMFRVSLHISGDHFKVGCFVPDDYYVTEKGESLPILQAFAACCVKVRDEYSAELVKDFGNCTNDRKETTPP